MIQALIPALLPVLSKVAGNLFPDAEAKAKAESEMALANKGKGGLWFGMSIVSGVSAVVGYALNYFKH